MEQIIRQLKKSRRVFIASHIKPDGDAIGSLIATALTLDALGKSVTMYNESPIPAVYRFLPDVNRIVRDIHPAGDMASYDTAVILDCGNISRIGDIADKMDKIPVVVNIDHHISNTGFGDLQYVDTDACATAEIIYRLIRKTGVPISRSMATAIYTGIFTDTGSFRFANTNKSAFSICDEMVSKGVDPYTVAQHLYGTYSLGRLKLLNLALDSIELLLNGELSFMTLTHEMMAETGTQPEDIDGMIHYAKRIEDVKVAVLIQETHNGLKNGSGRSYFHVSLRSDGSVDVAELAATFGGGGHQRAAGFNAELPLGKLKAEITDWFRNPENRSGRQC